MSVLSYCELALYGISESLQHSNIELPEETTQLCSSLHVGLRHAIALSCKESANAVLKRWESIITEAKSVICLPQLTGALRSAPLGESFLFQDSLEEVIKVQATLDPIPTKRVSWQAKKQTSSQAQSSYSGRDSLGGLPRSRPRAKAPRNVVPVGGQPRGVRGDKRGHIRPLIPRGHLTKPLPPPLFLLKEGNSRGKSQVTPPLPCRRVVGGRLQDFHATRRLGSIPGPTGRISSRPCTSRLPALSSILLRRSSIPVQSYAFRTGLCSADLSVNRKGVHSTATRTRVKYSFLPRRLAPTQHLPMTFWKHRWNCSSRMSNWLDGLWMRRSRIWLPPRTSYSSGFASAPVWVRQLSAQKFCQVREFLSLIGLLSSAWSVVAECGASWPNG
jgi:hypothetical protein